MIDENRVDKNRDFLNKNQKIDFFDLNRFFLFKSLFLIFITLLYRCLIHICVIVLLSNV